MYKRQEEGRPRTQYGQPLHLLEHERDYEQQHHGRRVSHRTGRSERDIGRVTEESEVDQRRARPALGP